MAAPTTQSVQSLKTNNRLLDYVNKVIERKKGDIVFYSALIATLLIWGLGVFILYRTIGGPDLAVTNRVNSFQSTMIRRLEVFGTIFIIIRMILFVIRNNEEKLLPLVIDNVKSLPMKLIGLVIPAAIGAATFIYLQVNYMSVKTAIPSIQPFYFDDLARKIDKVLFLGKDPWVYLAWIYDRPSLINALDRNYTIWATLIMGFWMYAFVTTRISRQRRFQYIISMILMWFLAGNILAILLSSAGPCYYHLFGSDPNYYAGLMSQLAPLHETVFLDAVDYQDTLLSMYNQPETRFGGISAAPSLHVGTSLLLLAFFWKSKITRWLLIFYNISIYVGSIVLAWHYAIDGLIVAPVALFCWYAAGKISTAIENKWPEDI